MNQIELEQTSDLEAWVENRIRSGQRVMGLGHAVYRTQDPRAEILYRIASQVLAGRPEERYLRLASRVNEIARSKLMELKGLDLYANVDFFSGPILKGLGLDMDFFPAFFAVARVSGWAAHVLEEQLAEAQPKPALYRPKAHYTGRLCGPQGCQFIPIEARGAGCPCGRDCLGCDESTALAEI